MGNIAKYIVPGIAIYLAGVGIAQYISQNSGTAATPTADQISSLPSFGSYGVNLVAGGALLLFHKQIMGYMGV